jgi:hypothetical protein
LFRASYIHDDWAIIWPILLWAVQLINLATLLLPILWIVVVWWGKYPRELFFGLTVAVVLMMWGANVGFTLLFDRACRPCYFN